MSAVAVAEPLDQAVSGCDCPACAAGLEPLTLPHFRAWAAEIELDNGEKWGVEPFQAAFLEDLFAFMRAGVPAECWLVIPEGNGKTTLVAGLALYVLEHVRAASIPVAAAAKEQADTLYLQGEGFVISTPRLAEEKPDVVLEAKGLRQLSPGRRKDVPRFQCQEGFRRIKFFAGGRLQIRAADERTADGIIPRGLMVIDELHRQRDLGLYRTWLGKGEKCGAPLVVISTAGEPGSEFEEVRAELRQGDDVTRDGCHVRSIGESYVLHEWAIPEGSDHDDLETVAAANPLSTVTAETLRRKRSKKSWNLAHWRRLTCNLATRGEYAAIAEADWAGAYTAERIPAGELVWVGLDLGWKQDTTAAVPLWWRDREFRLLGDAKVVVPPRDGTMLDSARVKRAIVEIHERNPIHTVVMDMSDARDIAEWLEDELRAIVVDRGQGNTLAVDDYNRFTEALREGWLRHTGCPDLKRHVLNANARILPYGDVRFDRPVQSRRSTQQQDRRVIDALIAAAMVHTSAAVELGDRDGEPLVAFA